MFSISAEIGMISPGVYPYLGIRTVAETGPVEQHKKPKVLEFELVWDVSAPCI